MDLQLSRTHISRYWAGTPEQHRQINRLYRRMRIGLAQHELSRNSGERILAPGIRLRPTLGVAPKLPRYGAPQGNPYFVQGRRWVVMAWKNQRVYDGGWSIPGPLVGRFGADQKLPFPPARYTTSTEAVRGSWCLQVHEASAFPRGIQRNVDDQEARS